MADINTGGQRYSVVVSHFPEGSVAEALGSRGRGCQPSLPTCTRRKRSRQKPAAAPDQVVDDDAVAPAHPGRRRAAGTRPLPATPACRRCRRAMGALPAGGVVPNRDIVSLWMMSDGEGMDGRRRRGRSPRQGEQLPARTFCASSSRTLWGSYGRWHKRWLGPAI